MLVTVGPPNARYSLPCYPGALPAPVAHSMHAKLPAADPTPPLGTAAGPFQNRAFAGGFLRLHHQPKSAKTRHLDYAPSAWDMAMTTELKLVHTQAPAAIGDRQPDYFTQRDGVLCAGIHLLLDLWQAHRLDDVVHVERTLRRAAEACQATLLHVHAHHFAAGGGVSGVAVLAESHISIHTWPERGYAALDIFMCGNCDPYQALPILKRAFTPGSVQISENRRGVVP